MPNESEITFFKISMHFVVSIFIATLSLWSVLALAEVEVQNAATPALLGQPSKFTAGTQYIHDFSREELAALRKAAIDTARAESIDGSSVESANADSNIESTVGTWFQGGHTAAWYNPAQDNHGLFVEILLDSTSPTGLQVFLAWYTYINGVPTWIIAQGPVNLEGNQHIARMTAWIYRGGQFPPNHDPSQVRRDTWGTMTLRFNGCDDAILTWTTFYAGFSSGQLDFKRLTTIAQTNCNPDLGGDSGGGSVFDVRVDFENRLLKTIQVFKNGVSLGTVPGTETRGDTYEVKAGDQFSFKTVQDFGDDMEGVYPVITNPNVSNLKYLADSIIGSNFYFIPYITNNTSLVKLLGINMELQAENRCNCTIPANTPNVVPGYYRLFSNGNLRLYDSGSNYTGPYTFWENFADFAETDTGKIDFILN